MILSGPDIRNSVEYGRISFSPGLARISHQGDTGLKFQAPTGSNTARTV